MSDKPHRHGDRESYSAVVPAKHSNQGGQLPAEDVEGRALTKENTEPSNPCRTPSRESGPSGLDRVRRAAKGDRKLRFTALLHHVSIDLLRTSYYSLKKQAAPGVDGMTWEEYGGDLEVRLADLHGRIHCGAYQARPSRRVWIPKSDGRQRPLGIAALEDKVVQHVVGTVLNQIWEEDFLGFSYGFRPGRSQHQALDALYVGITRKKVNWVLDLDIRAFLDPAPYYPLIHEMGSNRLGRLSMTLIRKPLRRPCLTSRASSSPRFTRCNTVCRETPSWRVASNIGRYSGGACGTMRARNSSVTRICQGAPGVTCSPAMNPSASQR